MTLRPIDIPQADSLQTVRRLLEVVSGTSDLSARNLSELTGFSERHVRYRWATARILGLLAAGKDRTSLTPRGRKLLRTNSGGADEIRQLRQAVARCPVVQEIAPGLLSDAPFDFQAVASRIATITGLSQSTAERRAQVLRAWRRQLGWNVV